MAPVLENIGTKLYTRNARLIPPLIDHFSENGNIRLNFIYLSPNCLQSHLLERANQHALTVLTKSDPQNTYWGLTKHTSNQTEEGVISFVTKGAQSIVTLIPADEVYADKQNSIIRASSVAVKTDEEMCPVRQE